jgi:uncharacterized coiled-coil protein SlyX
MKLFTAIIVIAGLFGANALAQTSEADPNAPVSLPDDPGTQPPANCENGNLEQCCTALDDCTDLLSGVAANRSQTPDQIAQGDCQSRNGIWQNSLCECTEADPNRHWFASDESPRECCVTNLRAYERRKNACNSEGDGWERGTWSCRGGCRCPMGTHLLDDRCAGEATTREEIDRLRQQEHDLTLRVQQLTTELTAAHADDGTQANRIADLDSQLAAARRELDLLRDELARLTAYVQSIGGTPPPAPPAVPLTPPAPFPGTPGAVADAVGGSENSMTDIVPPPAEGEETDESWCEANPGWCTVVIIGSAMAATGLGFGICAAAGCFDEEPHDRIYY